MNKVFALGLALSFAASALAIVPQSAEARRWGVNARQTRQQTRIGNGICGGNLSGREAARLERQQYKLAQQERRMRSSGRGLSWSERARLEREQNQLSHNIYRQKHDHNGR